MLKNIFFYNWKIFAYSQNVLFDTQETNRCFFNQNTVTFLPHTIYYFQTPFQISNIDFSNEVDISPDDSPQTEEHPYHSLSSSNLTLRRFGTVSSLERFGAEENEANWDDQNNSDLSSEDENEDIGIDNEAFYHSSIRNWTAKAGSFVAEKMAFFERFSEDCRSTGKFFEKYLKTLDVTVNGDDMQEDETSGATSGEEVWGTPTSGGELDDPLSSPNYEGKQSVILFICIFKDINNLYCSLMMDRYLLKMVMILSL